LHNHRPENDLYHIGQNAATTRASAVAARLKILPDYVLTRDSLKNPKIGGDGRENDRPVQIRGRKNGLLVVLDSCRALYS
jgi:hypothetical protein